MMEYTKEEINTGRAMLEYGAPLDYKGMMTHLDIMCERYKFISLSYIGESILGRGIPMITLGEEGKQVIYMGGQSGSDILDSMILLRFINEYCEILKSGGRIFNYSIKYLFGSRRICVIPMLNPDGVDININGVTDDNILKERLLSMNGSADFSKWRANARGVTIERNFGGSYIKGRKLAAERGIVSGCSFGFCGESPESEPEVGAVCTNARFFDCLRGAICLNGDRNGINYKTDVSLPMRSKSIGESLSRMSGYPIGTDEDIEMQGFAGFCVEELKIPAFNVGYGKNGSDNWKDTFFEAYARLRECLFTFPALI